MTSENDTLRKDTLEVIEYDAPNLKSGEYTVEIEQKVIVDKETKGTFVKKQDLTVRSRRFSLLPQDVHNVFPASGSLGDYSSSLPHIVLNNSSFPWERCLTKEKCENSEPWVALLIFDEKEFEEKKVREIELLELDNEKIKSFIGEGEIQEWEKYEEKDETGDETNRKIRKIMTIDVREDFLKEIMPDKNTLKYSTHTRFVKKDDGGGHIEKDKKSIVMSFRMPGRGISNTACLVSLEKRFNDDGFDYTKGKIKYENEDYIKLVVLKTWTFSSLPEFLSFKELLEELQTNSLGLEDKQEPNTNQMLKQGYVKISHDLRTKKKTESWYHGPLVVNSDIFKNIEFDWNLDSADNFTFFDKKNNILDVSYSCAFEIGKFLIMKSEELSSSLIQLRKKYNYAMQETLYGDGDMRMIGDLMENSEENSPINIFMRWSQELLKFKDFPYHYILPNEEMLGYETMKYFQVDLKFFETIICGSLSFAKINNKVLSENHNLRERIMNKFREEVLKYEKDSQGILKCDRKLSGVLLRSELVKNFPDFKVKGFNTKNSKEEEVVIFTKNYLDESVVMVVFEGEIDRVDLFLPPQGLFLGFDEIKEKNNSRRYEKEVELSNGNKETIREITFSNKELRIINLEDLKEKFLNVVEENKINPAILGMYLLKGVPRGRYSIKTKTNGGSS